MNNSESKMLITDKNGNTQEIGALMTINTVPLFMGVDLGTGPDRTGCGFVYPKLKMGEDSGHVYAYLCRKAIKSLAKLAIP